MENQKILNFISQKFPELVDLNLQQLDDNEWIVEGSRSIRPCEFNDFAECKFEGHIIKKIQRNQFKQYIKDRIIDFMD